MNYVMTVQVKKLQANNCGEEVEYAPKSVLEKAFVLDNFDIAKKKFRETVSETAKGCKFFPYTKGKYEPLADFCKDVEEGTPEELKSTSEDVEMIVLDEISKFLDDPDYFGFFPEEVWGFEEHTFITRWDEIYYDIDGEILHFNAIDMSDSQKTYFFDYRDMDGDYEPIHSISIFMKPVDTQ